MGRLAKSQSKRHFKNVQANAKVQPGRRANVDDDALEGLGKVHNDDFLALEENSDEDSDEEMEDPIVDLKESDEDEESDDLDEEQLTGLEAKLVKQSKIMKQRAQLEDDEDDEDEDDEEDIDRAAWGKSKQIYYNADNVDFELQSDDDEAPAEEEAEALRQQRKTAESLRPEDFEQDEEESDDGEETLQDAVKRIEGKSSGSSKKTIEAAAVEEVKKDMTTLTKEEKMDVVMSAAPELLGMLTELREGLDELRNKVEPLVEKVKDGQYATREGISYLEVKHLLLLSYCQSIVFYLLLKAEGRPVRDHPVISRLVELRLFLEKIRPIDKKLDYQIDKLLKTGIVSATQSNEQRVDALKYRPHPDLLVSKLDQAADDGGGLYRPPMIAPVAMEEDMHSKERKRTDRAERETRRRASRSAFMKEIANELEGKPEEVHEAVAIESREMMREKERLDARSKEEEEMFARVPLSRVERKKLKQLKKSKSGMMDLLDDVDDGLADLVGMDELQNGASAGGPPDDLLKPRKLSQIIAESGRAAKKAKVVSGDADLPVREDLGERRRKRETHTRPPLEGDEEPTFHEDHQGFEPEEDEFYKEAKELAAAKKAAKLAKYHREPEFPVVAEEEGGKRHITNTMEKNRGLTPHRKKLIKNPRKKYKLKHGKALVRRKGQVREMKHGGGSYGGESTGIKTNISRSTRL